MRVRYLQKRGNSSLAEESRRPSLQALLHFRESCMREKLRVQIERQTEASARARLLQTRVALAEGPNSSKPVVPSAST